MLIAGVHHLYTGTQTRGLSSERDGGERCELCSLISVACLRSDQLPERMQIVFIGTLFLLRSVSPHYRIRHHTLYTAVQAIKEKYLTHQLRESSFSSVLIDSGGLCALATECVCNTLCVIQLPGA